VPRLLSWYAVSARDLPWRRTHDPYAIWVSEIMLQQTQVKTVIPYWERWMRALPSIESLANAKPQKIHKLWEGLGYYTRVRNMQKAAKQIVLEHKGRFPASLDGILALPGIGRYTAGAVGSIAFNLPAPILDGNVIRVLTRLHGIGEDPQDKQTNVRLWELAQELAAHAAGLKNHKAACSHLNQSLMELGAVICTPRAPSCASCPVASGCAALRDGRVAELPRPKDRAAMTGRRFVAFVVEQEGRFLVQQRAAGTVNAHLWEFPNWEVPGTWPAAAVAKKHFRITSPSLEKLCVIKHSITRYRITTEAYRLKREGANGSVATPSGAWRTKAQLHKLAFTSAHRQIADKI